MRCILPELRAWRKTVRRWLPWRKLLYPIQSQLVALADAVGLAIHNMVGLRLPARPALWRVVVPGWAQLYSGERAAG